jgi:hypothetical protein
VRAKRAKNAFTRNRLLPLPVLVAFLLSGVAGSVQTELNRFFAHLANVADQVRIVTAQAFSKARHKLDMFAFHEVNRKLLALIEQEVGIPRWHGLRVVAGDGSKVRLTLWDKETETRYISENVMFGLFLPGVEMFLDLCLFPQVADERQMLLERSDVLQPDDLLVLDRGFPSRALLNILSHRGIAFCMRCDSSHGFKAVCDFMRSSATERVVSIPAPDRRGLEGYDCPASPTTVRLVRIVTPAGTQIAVMTSLLDADTYPASAFCDLYHRRWRIEEAFKRLKHRLALESTSGLSWHAAQQDVGAKAVCDNLNALAVYLASDKQFLLDVISCRINRTATFSLIKPQIGRWLLKSCAPALSIPRLFSELLLNLQKFIPLRSRPRNFPPRKPHRAFAYKGS